MSCIIYADLYQRKSYYKSILSCITYYCDLYNEDYCSNFNGDDEDDGDDEDGCNNETYCTYNQECEFTENEPLCENNDVDQYSCDFIDNNISPITELKYEQFPNNLTTSPLRLVSSFNSLFAAFK